MAVQIQKPWARRENDTSGIAALTRLAPAAFRNAAILSSGIKFWEIIPTSRRNSNGNYKRWYVCTHVLGPALKQREEKLIGV